MRLKNLEILTKKKDFQFNKKYGVSYYSRSLIIQVSRSQMDYKRVGFIVSGKVGKAITRNLIKRRLRVIVQELLAHTDLIKDCVIIAKRSASSVLFSCLRQDFIYCLNKIAYK